MKLVDLRRKPLADFDMSEADGYAQQPDLRLVFDEHAGGIGSSVAPNALAYLLELYGNARGIDESLHPQQGHWVLNFHIASFLTCVLDYADSYAGGTEIGGSVAFRRRIGCASAQMISCAITSRRSRGSAGRGVDAWPTCCCGAAPRRCAEYSRPIVGRTCCRSTSHRASRSTLWLRLTRSRS